MGLLDGKVVLISGGARGQGRAHAVLSAREGADVIIFDINEQIPSLPYAVGTAEEMKETVRQVQETGGKILALTADARSQDQMNDVVARGIAEFGKIDVVVINHGIVSFSPFWETTEEAWNNVIDVNLSGVWRLAKAVAPHLIERRSGSIVITSSVNGVRPAASFAHYISAKHGVIGLMKAIARELATYNVRCNAVLPGPTATPMIQTQEMYDSIMGHPNATEEEVLEAGRSFVALRNRTWLEPEEIAKTALYLNSDLAANVTGQSIAVDAGHLLLDGHNWNPEHD